MIRIFLVGYMGAGKSTLGKALARTLGVPFIDLDQYIEGQTMQTIREIFQDRGEDGFRQLEREMLHQVVEQGVDAPQPSAHHQSSGAAGLVISCGGGTPCFFDNMDYMNACGQTLLLDVPIDVLFRRLKHGTRKRPVLRDKTDEDLRQFIISNLESRMPHYAKARYSVDASCLESRMQVAATVDEVRRILKV